MILDYKKLVVWQKVIELTKEVYILTKNYPKEEQFGLISQMRRCAVSIPSNIAEGVMRRSNKEFRSFLFIAFGSGGELETQVYISKTLDFGAKLNYSKVDELLSEVMKMLNALIVKVNNLETRN